MGPPGTVTFLFTNIKGSTHLWETHLEQMQLAFAHQEQILRTGVEAFDGDTQKAHPGDDRYLAGYSQKPRKT